MQLFRPSNDSYQQSYNYQSSIKPYPKPLAYGGNDMTQCQTQTQCFDTQLPAAGGGYGMQHAAVAQGYGGTPFVQKPFVGHGSAHQGSFGSMQQHLGGGHGHGLAHQGSFGSVQQHVGGHGLAHTHQSFHVNMAHNGSYGTGQHGTYGSAHHGSYGSVCEPQSAGGYSYTMKRKERRSWKRRSGNDSDCSGSDESDDEKC